MLARAPLAPRLAQSISIILISPADLPDPPLTPFLSAVYQVPRLPYLTVPRFFLSIVPTAVPYVALYLIEYNAWSAFFPTCLL